MESDPILFSAAFSVSHRLKQRRTRLFKVKSEDSSLAQLQVRFLNGTFPQPCRRQWSRRSQIRAMTLSPLEELGAPYLVLIPIATTCIDCTFLQPCHTQVIKFVLFSYSLWSALHRKPSMLKILISLMLGSRCSGSCIDTPATAVL